MTRILIIEDNADLAFGLRRTLEFEGYGVDVAEDGESGMDKVREGRPDLVLLDLMLPGKGGFQILWELRGEGNRVPVLVLTARGEESDVVLGFDSGADDYVTKPFSTLELLARVRALLRRRGSSEDGPHPGGDGPGGRPWGFGAVEVEPASRSVTRAGVLVPLTPKEFDLLTALYRRDGALASRPELLDEVWGYANTDVATRTVDIHVAELRRKLEEDPSDPKYLLTVRKAGYRLQR